MEFNVKGKKCISFLSLSMMLFISSCKTNDAIEATRNMPEKLDNMNAEMKKTTHAIHDQTLLLSLQEMEKDENFRDKSINYFALPLDLLPGGEVFAKEATALELAKLSFLYLRNINEVSANENLKVYNEQTGTSSYPKDYEERADFEKFKKLTVIQVIAGFVSQEKTEQIVKEQIEDGGIYEEGAYTFLTLRAQFIKTILLEDRILVNGIKNVGQLEEAYKCIQQIDYIYNLPFQKNISVKIYGMINSDYNQTLSLDSDGVAPLYQKVLTSLDYDLKPQYRRNKKVLEIKNEIKKKLEYLN